MIKVAAEDHQRDSVGRAVAAFRTPCVIDEDGRHRRTVRLNGEPAPVGSQAVVQLGGLYPEWLGDRSFNEVHGVRAPYVAGAMANGIASPRLVVAMARAGLLGVFGAGGLSFDRVRDGLDAIERALPPGGAWASNLIHSPHEPALEEAVAELYLQRGVRRVSASAYLQLTPAVVRYAATGIRDDGRRIVRRNHVLAKVSHPEVARAFMSPAPRRLLDGLVERGQLTSEEARLARRVPVAEDVTVEADSGGHTDNRPLGALLPVLVRLRDGIVRDHDYPRPLRVGAAGGLGTPAALAAAFAMGADYVLTGSVNQASVEAALSRRAKELLLDANLADVTMAPSPDMFEMGVKVQVLRRGTLFAQRAQRLYDVYIAHRDLTALPVAVRAEVESILGDPLDVAWARTAAFWRERDPGELERAERDARHRMALTFRSYVGLASRWAIDGNEARLHDFQIWCGPAQGAFNDWVRGTPLEPLEARGVVTIAHHLLEGAAACTRAAQLRSLGVAVPASCFTPTPR